MFSRVGGSGERLVDLSFFSSPPSSSARLTSLRRRPPSRRFRGRERRARDHRSSRGGGADLGSSSARKNKKSSIGPSHSHREPELAVNELLQIAVRRRRRHDRGVDPILLDLVRRRGRGSVAVRDAGGIVVVIKLLHRHRLHRRIHHRRAVHRRRLPVVHVHGRARLHLHRHHLHRLHRLHRLRHRRRRRGDRRGDRGRSPSTAFRSFRRPGSVLAAAVVRRRRARPLLALRAIILRRRVRRRLRVAPHRVLVVVRARHEQRLRGPAFGAVIVRAPRGLLQQRPQLLHGAPERVEDVDVHGVPLRLSVHEHALE
mmetsp:Transcript_11376/g.41045  ORF Transcript_11376/g.41045 Transcript_11376/m.41045 type:complete len:314 (+) Transcript_11376:118-1059(+)